MARVIIPLTDKKIQNAKAKEKKYKLSDGGGLFLEIRPNGSKLWRLSYRINGKSKEYAIGTLQEYSLQEAREQREKLKKLVARGVDINEKKKQDKRLQKEITEKKENTFYKISQLWLKDYIKRKELSENYSKKLGNALSNYVYPSIKDKPIEEVTRKDIRKILEFIADTKGHRETAHRLYTQLNSIYMYAVTHEYVELNIIRDIDKSIVIGKVTKKHYPTLTKEKDIRGLLLAIDDYNGDYSTQMALKIMPYVFLRPYNIRHAEWSEIDFKAKEWVIKAEKMKMKTEFILPLPPQVMKILEEMREYKLSQRYIFPSSRYKDRAMSSNTLNSAIRRMGFTKEEFVSHGFRSMFSTIANTKANHEGADKRDIIEALLAHKEKNKIREAYNRTSNRDLIKPMREVIEWYADYLDEVKRGSKKKTLSKI
jgi:integrase